MKKILVSSILIVGLATGLAFAKGNNWSDSNMMMGDGQQHGLMEGGMRGTGMMGYAGSFNCPGANSVGQGMVGAETNQKYMDQTVDLRKQMHDLRFDYMEAQRNPNSTKESLSTLEQKMNDLHTKMSAISEQLRVGKS